MSALESAIEARAVLELRKVGAIAIKVGKDGWPDRMVIYAPNRFTFMEFKQPGETLDPRQRLRKKELSEIGQEVHVVTSYREALGIVAAARRALPEAERRNIRNPAQKKGGVALKTR